MTLQFLKKKNLIKTRYFLETKYVREKVNGITLKLYTYFSEIIYIYKKKSPNDFH